MEQRTITDNQRDILSFKMAEIVLSLSQDENVQCISFNILYDVINKENSFMTLTVLCDNPDDFAFKTNIEDFNKNNDEGYLLADFGLIVDINLKKSKLEDYYDLLDLCESTILYDRTGDYRALKNEITENRELYLGSKYYFNKVEIQPPLETSIKEGIQELKKIMDTDSSKMSK